MSQIDCDNALPPELTWTGATSLDAHRRNCQRQKSQPASDEKKANERPPQPAIGVKANPLSVREKLSLKKLMPVIERVARASRSKRKGVEIADLIQEGIVHAIVAIRKFDPNRGDLESFAGWFVQKRLINYTKKESHWRGRHLQMPTAYEIGDSDEPCQTEHDEEMRAIDLAVQRLRHILSSSEIELLELRGSMRDTEIAQRWGCSDRWVRRVREDAKKALQREADLTGAPKAAILAALLDHDANGEKCFEQLLCQKEEFLENSSSAFSCRVDT